MGKYFGTDGFRGEANVNLTVEHAFKVGRFLGWYYAQKNPAEIERFQPDLVGVSGFEPEASWSRTKRDTKLRHTPSARLL